MSETVFVEYTPRTGDRIQLKEGGKIGTIQEIFEAPGRPKEALVLFKKEFGEGLVEEHTEFFTFDEFLYMPRRGEYPETSVVIEMLAIDLGIDPNKLAARLIQLSNLDD